MNSSHPAVDFRAARFLTLPRFLWLGLGLLVSPGGCPPATPDPSAPAVVTAKITVSATRGPAPLTVAFSAGESTSQAAPITKIEWDFADGTRAAQAAPTHTFANPGRYSVKLTVTDEAGNQGTAVTDIRAQGNSAVAVIQADTNSGPAALLVHFDGAASHADDDTILDYFWDFGDGEESRRVAPTHTFLNAGTYIVKLRVVTGGGVEAGAETTITVGVRRGALQFNGAQLATLPFNVTGALSTFTFEAWFKAGATSGALAILGDQALLVQALPASNKVRVEIGTVNKEAATTALTNIWHHVAVSYDGAGGATIYLDGVSLGTLAATGDLNISRIVVGSGFDGKIAAVRFWSTARSAAEIAGGYQARVVNANGLLGGWPLNEGSGQLLNNVVLGNAAGTRGASAVEEDGDPAWSSDGPPLP